MKRLIAVLLFFAAAAAHAQYPQRPVQLIVPWGAGGGTDATARIIASLLERELKQPINVVNRTGGSGVVGHQAIASSPADGYTLGMITVEITMMHWVGLTPLTYKDYTPVGLVGERREPNPMHHGDLDGDHAQGVEIGRRRRDRLVSDDPGAAGAIDDVDRLLQLPLEEAGDDAGGGVGTAARAPGHDQLDRTLRILRVRGGGREEQQNCDESFHGLLLRVTRSL